MTRRPPKSTPCPYTTLFRSLERARHLLLGHARLEERGGTVDLAQPADDRVDEPSGALVVGLQLLGERQRHRERSEEHTSELQSRQYLVCRLLLEKKKSCVTT